MASCITPQMEWNRIDRMLERFKGRMVDHARPVKVYRNLTNKCYSVMQDGLIKAHSKALCLKDVTFRVNEAGRQRVIREKRKNVHAFVIGTLTDSGMGRDHTAGPGDLPVKITYNPYKAGTFMTKDFTPETVVTGCMFVVINEHGVQGAYLD